VAEIQAKSGAASIGMKNVSRIVLVVFLLVIAGGIAFLASWDIPAPRTTVEKVLPDDRFPR
jgi:hypothetical protein